MILFGIVLILFLMGSDEPSKSEIKKAEQKRRKDLRYDIQKATRYR